MKKWAVTLLFPVSVMASTTGTGTHFYQPGESLDVACTIAEIKAFKDIALKKHGATVENQYDNICKDITPSTSKDDLVSCVNKMTTSIYHNGGVKKITDRRITRYNDRCEVTIMAETFESKFIDVSVNGKQDYMHGDKVFFDITTDTPVYVYVFLKHTNHTELIFPKHPSNLHYMRQKAQFPFYMDEFRIWLNNGMTKGKKTFVFLFTREKVGFNKPMLVNYTYEELIETLPPSNRRVIEKDIYVVR